MAASCTSFETYPEVRVASMFVNNSYLCIFADARERLLYFLAAPTFLTCNAPKSKCLEPAK